MHQTNLSPNQRAVILEERLISFSVEVIAIAEALPKSPTGQYFCKQLIRSGSAPALLYGEARGAESNKD
ncbi:MAG: four helix bundle protein, partial [Bacteroidota bacterium]